MLDRIPEPVVASFNWVVKMRPRLHPIDEGRLFRGYRIGCAASALGVLSQTKAARIGDAIRRELG